MSIAIVRPWEKSKQLAARKTKGKIVSEGMRILPEERVIDEERGREYFRFVEVDIYKVRDRVSCRE